MRFGDDAEDRQHRLCDLREGRAGQTCGASLAGALCDLCAVRLTSYQALPAL